MKKKKTINEFVLMTGELGTNLGLNRTVGQMYGLLYMAGKPLSMDEIAKGLCVSKASVCLNARELEQWGAIKKIWTSGSRRDFYEADPDFVGIMFRRAKARLKKILGDFGATASAMTSKKAVPGAQKQRIKKVLKTHTLLLQLVNSLPETMPEKGLENAAQLLSLLSSSTDKNGK
jgi:DNA-binding transcriptional regulator GbsR (MarR family)